MQQLNIAQISVEFLYPLVSHVLLCLYTQYMCPKCMDMPDLEKLISMLLCYYCAKQYTVRAYTIARYTRQSKLMCLQCEHSSCNSYHYPRNVMHYIMFALI